MHNQFLSWSYRARPTVTALPLLYHKCPLDAVRLGVDWSARRGRSGGESVRLVGRVASIRSDYTCNVEHEQVYFALC